MAIPFFLLSLIFDDDLFKEGNGIGVKFSVENRFCRIHASAGNAAN
jgi:hypothetical protein